MTSSGDYHAFYAAAHHDTWWAKSQQWSAAGWAIALLGGIAGLTKALDLAPPPQVGRSWLAVLDITVAVGGVIYIARLHFDTIRARQITAKLRELHPPLQSIAEKLPGWPGRSPDDVRGAIFPLFLVLAVAIAHGISTYLVIKNGGWSAGLAIVVLLTGLASVAGARAAA